MLTKSLSKTLLIVNDREKLNNICSNLLTIFYVNNIFALIKKKTALVYQFQQLFLQLGIMSRNLERDNNTKKLIKIRFFCDGTRTKPVYSLMTPH